MSIMFPDKCAKCDKVLPLTSLSPFCEKCKNDLLRPEKTVFMRENLDAICTCFIYEGTTAKMIKKFKYHGRRDIGDYFSEELMANIRENFSSSAFSAVTYIPISKKNKKIRYNQSLVLAKNISKQLNIPCLDLFRKKRRSKSQTECRTRAERRQNAKKTFYLHNSKVSLKGKRILIIDDVCTTASTLCACANLLKKAGTSEVFGAVVAKTDIHHPVCIIRHEFNPNPKPRILVVRMPYDITKMIKDTHKYIHSKERRKRVNEYIESKRNSFNVEEE